MKRWGGESRRILIISVCALLALLLMLFGFTATGIVNIPVLNSVISRVFVPVQNAVTGAINSISTSMNQRRTQMELTTQVDELTEENKILRASLEQMNELSLENERLKALLGVTQAMPEYTYIAASVSGKEPGGWFESFTLNVGAAHGVSKDDIVLTNDGLVGRITSVYETSSVVMAIIDSRSAVSAIVERTRDNGVARGSLFLTDNSELMQMHYLPADSETIAGDRVITSGLDGIYPKGQYIGTVRSISRDQNDEGRYVIVDTAVDFTHLENVLVMLLGGQGVEAE